ncbi:hypothetical protein ABVK25_000444 [Lepraria finkii]|uniref:GATA-type domain-containing protein n=1 Tax=Lepraria finkii TaxID=1340010 RepID=A0ABR4BMX1_9LECA
MLGRTNSVATKHSNRSGRDSIQLGHPSSERILSWRQSISSTNGSLDNFRLNHGRSTSPRKSLGQTLQAHNARYPSEPNSVTTPSLPTNSQQHSPQHSTDEFKNQTPDTIEPSQKPYSAIPKTIVVTDPLMLHGEQSYMFWNQSTYAAQAATASHLDPHRPNHQYDGHNGDWHSQNTSTAGSSSVSVNCQHLGVPMNRETTTVSRLSSEEESDADDSPPKGEEEGEKVVCKSCSWESFEVRLGSGHQGKRQIFQCKRCGQRA